MELGATICLPRNPQCLLCPVAAHCQARVNSTQDRLPIKIVEQRRVQETRGLLWIEDKEHLLVWQRPAESRLMPGFWELPESIHLPAAKPGRLLGSFRHAITFHSYTFELLEAAASSSSNV